MASKTSDFSKSIANENGFRREPIQKYIPKYFNQNVIIRGTNPVFYSWKMSANPSSLSQSITLASGLLIDIRDRLFILSTRKDLAACTKFQCFYTVANCPNVFSQDLQIIFSSADFDIVLLGSNNLDHFDPKLDKNFNSNEHTLNTFDLGKIRDHFVLPKLSAEIDPLKNCYTIVQFNDALGLVPGSIVSKTSAKLFFIGTSIIKFLDAQPMVCFTFDIDQTIKLDILEGSPIYGPNGKLHGIVTKVHTQTMRAFVLPTKVLSKVLYDFADHRISPDSYKGIVDLPICYDTYKGKVIVSQKFKKTVEGTEHNPNPLPFIVGLYDVITKVNGFPLSINSGVVYVEDQHDYKISLPLDLYISLYFGLGDSVDLTFDRNGIVYTLRVECVPSKQMAEALNRIRISSQPYFYPKEYIPHTIDSEKIVYTQLTYELIRALMETSHSDIFIKSINFSNLDQNTNCIIQIDCLSAPLAKSRSLHRLLKKN
jgi:hypothetical protein